MTSDKITVYEKPTCSKCRDVMKILTDKGIAFEPVNYLEQPLTADELKELLRKAGLKAHEAIRKNEPAYKQFIAEQELTEDELIRVMADHPELIQRPIVVRGDKAVLARSSERLEDLGI